MTRLFTALQDWWERRAILCDIRRQQGDNAERNRFLARDELANAVAALETNDHRKATAIWTHTVEHYPAEILGQPLALDVLLKLKRYDEAEALMRQGCKKHPVDPYFAQGLALVALEKGDYDTAIEHCAALRKRFPGVHQGYTLGAQVLAAKSRLEEADALSRRAMKKFPEEIAGFLEYARLAVRREDWAEAMRRWQIIATTFQNRTFGPLGQAQALIRIGRYDEADNVLAAAILRFPCESALLAEAARCAQARGDVPEAINRWKHLIARVPLEAHGYQDAARAFETMGKQGEAEAILRAAADRFSPGETY